MARQVGNVLVVPIERDVLWPIHNSIVHVLSIHLAIHNIRFGLRLHQPCEIASLVYAKPSRACVGPRNRVGWECPSVPDVCSPYRVPHAIET